MLKIKNLLHDFNIPKEIINELDWVVDSIRNKSLFDVDLCSENEEMKNLSEKNMEVKSYINLISNYTNVDKPKSQFFKRSSSLSKHQKSKLESNEINEKITRSVRSKIKNTVVVKKSNFLKTLEDKDNYIEVKNTVKRSPEKSTTVTYESKFDLIKPSEQDEKTMKKVVDPSLEAHHKKSKFNAQAESKEKKDLILSKLERFQSDKPHRASSPYSKLLEDLKTENKPEYDFTSIDFDIFKYSDKVGRENVFNILFKNIIERVELDNLKSNKGSEEKLYIDKNKLNNFSNAIKNGYNPFLPYHSDLHGIDVCQTLFSWFNFTNISTRFDFNAMDIFSIHTAGLVHDFKHPGLNNNYFLNTRGDLAITYNDKSVLENFHVSETFKVLLKDEHNIFNNLNLDEFKDMRKRMIEAILATDMSFHFKSVSILKGKMDYLDIKEGKNIEKLINGNSAFNDQQEIINFIVHSADISHNVKEWSISEKWSLSIYEEFFKQGEIEKKSNLPISMFCDRDSTNIPKAQIGFLSAIITPTFELLIRIFPNFKKIINNVNKNNENWERMLHENEKKIEKKKDNSNDKKDKDEDKDLNSKNTTNTTNFKKEEKKQDD